MVVLAVSAELWVGLIGVALGGLLGFATHAYVRRSERAQAIEERSRAERKDAYSALLTSAENSLHRFQWLADRHVDPHRIEHERIEANFYYDQEVTPRYFVLRMTATDAVATAARELRKALNEVRKLFRAEALPTKESAEWKKAHGDYRYARAEFLRLALIDLKQPSAPASVSLGPLSAVKRYVVRLGRWLRSAVGRGPGRGS